ncbi:DUF2867 domain-containing protein [Mycobacterium paraseoulense]|uniref:DUF2867 domain-containing protein n=1 Tax=Mycobacterium paraseoulense TaxID=590652 RepID=A0A1X0I4B6_9MYCO|nr:DUF2867 domain-containing protein [Mycobacterium paraseoulense]MCV7398266.1 DUF2867 domain-containing protein [Mycobacterium paraseoulense]ORB33804.1 hypothetical protein BST39_25435 [Mycobacterium paraseoulense]BBZ73277.1 hypothetical protein MPRS_43700 [Mycobacterium paraseoulense]
MERLPYIDEHAITVGANRADTWSALLRVLCRDPGDPSTVPTGFVLDEARPPVRFALKGRHLFAVYRWVFELEDDAPRRTRVRAATWAAFPGARGKAYRALVIGTGAHRVVTRWTLKRVAAAAERADYEDVFEVPLPQGDSRTAEQTFRDAVGPGSGGGVVPWIHRHVLRFRLGPYSSPEHIIGWTMARSDRDELVLTARGPLMHGELTLRRQDDRRASLTTRVQYCHKTAARTVWAVVGPLHRAVAPRLMKRAAVWQPVPA